MIKKYNDISEKLDKLRDKGTPKGDVTGFSTLDSLFTIKQGSFTFILGAPHQGKSELAFELCFNQAQRFHKKCLINSSETGSVEEIYAEFIHKYTGKSIYKTDPLCCKDKEYYAAINWIDEYFSIVDSEESAYSFEELFEMCTDEKILLADPYNEIKHDMTGFNGRQDLYIEELMSEVRRFNKKNNKHTIITLHPASQSLKEEKVGNLTVRYYPMPMAREAAGGQALFRKAMTWINIWRPAAGLKDTSGKNYEGNEVIYMVEKAKPKGVATKGVGSLFFDTHRNRFYENIGNLSCYAFQHENINTDSFEAKDFTQTVKDMDIKDPVQEYLF